MNVNIESFNEIFENEQVKEAIRKYQESSRPIHLGFNVFSIISDTYYKEDFHSDILAELLRLENQKVLKSFIEHLNKIIRVSSQQETTCKEILWTDFETGSNIHREKGRIDIGIENPQSKSVIIIENKINWADDMERQLPRYVEFYKDYENIYVVYLPIDRNKKKPNEYGWTKDDRTKVYQNFITLFAYNQIELDLFSWIRSCIAEIEKVDILSTFRQYTKLIQIKGQYIMDMTSVKEFYEKGAKDKNLQDLLSFRDMIDTFPEYFTEKIEKDLKEKDYVKAKSYSIGTWNLKDKNRDAVCSYLQFNNKSKLQLDIYLSKDKQYFNHFNLSIWSWENNNQEYILNIIPEIQNYFSWDNNWLGPRFYKVIHFQSTMEESFKELFTFLDDFIPKMQEFIEKNDK